MTETNRDYFLDSLETGWGTYVERFRAMDPQAQAAVLQDQGYASLKDLLAHVIAWWQEGRLAIEEVLEGSYSGRNYDVDEFNAQAVASVRDVPEDEMLRLFEEARLLLVDLVAGLPEEAFTNQEVVRHLEMEVSGHLEEHELP